VEVFSPQRNRLGRNDACHCGSGRKYKNCHLDLDEVADRDRRADSARAAREEHLDKGFPEDIEHYHPLTRKIPAVERQDFRILVQRLSQTGTPMLVQTPQDLSRDQDGLAEALRFCADRGVSVEFRSDPPLAMIAGLQTLLDGMYGRGVYQLRQSGMRLHGYGRTRQVEEDGKAVFYLALPGRSAARAVLAESARAEAEAVGIADSPLRRLMASARVLRHLTVHFLDLSEWAQNIIGMLLGVVIDEVTDRAQVEDEMPMGQGSEVTTVFASLPFAVALPEAVDSPASALEGMGLSEEEAAILVPHLEHIHDSLPWIRRAGEVTGDEWETPEGFAAWQESMASIPEMGAFLQFSIGREEAVKQTAGHEMERAIDADPEAENLPVTSAREADAAPTLPVVPPVEVKAAEGAPLVITTEAAPRAMPPVPDDPELFSAIRRLREEYATRRDDVAASRVGTERERDDAQQERAEAEEQARKIGVTIDDLTLRLAALDDKLTQLGDEERASRTRTMASILESGARRLCDASATWEDRQAQAVDVTLVKLEKSIAEYEEMVRSGLLEQLPALARQREEEVVAQARAALHERYGDREPLVLPVAVLGAAEEAEPVIALAIPLRGDAATLAPGSVGVAIASAVCDGVREAFDAMDISVLAVKHAEAGSCAILRYRLLRRPEMTVAESLDLIGIGAESAADHSSPLRQARIGLRCVAVPEVDEDELASALLSVGPGDAT
jgi:hypothetical protein